MVLSCLFLTVVCWLLVILQDFLSCLFFVYEMKGPIFSLYSRYSVFLTQSLVCTFCSCLYTLWRISSKLFAGFRLWIYGDSSLFSVLFQFVLFLFILKCSSGTVAFWPDVNSCKRCFEVWRNTVPFPFLPFSQLAVPTACVVALELFPHKPLVAILPVNSVTGAHL